VRFAPDASANGQAWSAGVCACAAIDGVYGGAILDQVTPRERRLVVVKKYTIAGRVGGMLHYYYRDAA